ncbi:hypothetical protein [Cellvibrio sp. pealriver]|uniref:hypothetical protein n=1 Tax=Cellvibrio sp. pealriver TaxID=1622269 RepID=UPI00066FB498|nr:hypothetical protein [Cellvibrio sp. pealriver]
MKNIVATLAGGFLLGSIFLAPSLGIACTKDEAFGFKFGNPVPRQAKDVKEFYFQGGVGAGNVRRSFQVAVPSPMEHFPDYVYWSNRDRKAVHSIVGFRQLISDKTLLSDEVYRTSVLEKTKNEIAQLHEEWGKLYGIAYKQTSQSGLTWSGENEYVRSTIGIYGGEYLYIECTNKALHQIATEIAWKSELKQ